MELVFLYFCQNFPNFCVQIYSLALHLGFGLAVRFTVYL